MNQQSVPPNATPMIFWIIWFAIFAGMPVIYYTAVPKPTEGAEEVEQVYSLFTFIAIAACSISMIIRWLVIPRMKTHEQLLQAMIMGVALAEGAGIIAMFVVPVEQVSEKSLMLSMSVACLLLSAPIYAKKKLAEIFSHPSE